MPAQAGPAASARGRALAILALQLSMVLFAGSNVALKYAGRFPLVSWPCILLFGAALFLMGLYAIVWQQVIRRVSIVTAYGNRATVMIWNVLLGFLLFSEQLTWNMLFGGIVILLGVYLVVTANES